MEDPGEELILGKERIRKGNPLDVPTAEEARAKLEEERGVLEKPEGLAMPGRYDQVALLAAEKDKEANGAKLAKAKEMVPAKARMFELLARENSS